MTDIYESFDRAFAKVSAYAILKDGRAIGRVAIKYPRDGMGRATAYLQVWGLPMVKGTANGCGYDKTTAAMGNAGAALLAAAEKTLASPGSQPEPRRMAVLMACALMGKSDGGQRWDDRLRDAGFTTALVI